ncbi:c-type cytochrome [Hydrogenophaga sp.]|uniref:c-type cytochrome n=1 Tax=Hydrogenophaga sp. TaxID=1904254 RepID=UPI003D2AC6E2
MKFRFPLPVWRVWVLAIGWALTPLAIPAPFEDTLAQRLVACTACHGPQARAAPDGYYPRLAGKPAGYLTNQLLNFRDGQRQYRLMSQMVEPLSEAYLLEIAEHFAAMEVPYPAPAPVQATAGQRQRGEQPRCAAMLRASCRPAPAATVQRSPACCPPRQACSVCRATI